MPDAVLAKAEWKTIRYRLLHTAARITRSGRRLHLRLHKVWLWALALARAFTVLRRIPFPAFSIRLVRRREHRRQALTHLAGDVGPRAGQTITARQPRVDYKHGDSPSTLSVNHQG